MKRGVIHEAVKHAISDRAFRNLSAKTLTLRETDLDLIAERLIDDLAVLAIKAKADREKQGDSDVEC